MTNFCYEFGRAVAHFKGVEFDMLSFVSICSTADLTSACGSDGLKSVSILLTLYVKRYSGIFREHRFLQGESRTLCGALISSFSVVYWGARPTGAIILCEKCKDQERKIKPLLEVAA